MKKTIVKSLLCLSMSAVLFASDILPAVAAETTDAEVIATEEVAEDVAVEATEAVESTGTAGVPAKVTGVAISGKYLTWDSMEQTAFTYDVKATDVATGVTYYSWYIWDETKGQSVWGGDSATDHPQNISSNTYSLSNKLRTSTPDAAEFGIAGLTYSYQVRAVNRVTTTDAAGNETYQYTYGPWSNAVKYTVPKFVTLKISQDTSEDNGNYLVLKLDKKIETGYVYLNFYSDAACTQEFYTSCKTPGGDGTRISAALSSYYFEAGKTYYVKVYNADQYYYDTTDMAKSGVTYSNVLAFKIPAKVTEIAPAFKDLKATVSDDGAGVYLNTSAMKIMDDYSSDHGVDLYYSMDANAADDAWKPLGTMYSSSNKGYYLSYSDLARWTREPGKKVYIKAKAYVFDDDDWTYKYGAWSNMLTLTSPAITKITKLDYEQTDSGFDFTYTGTVKPGEWLVLEYSTSKKFTNNFTSENDAKKITKTTTGSSLSYSQLEPGKTYYVRAYVRSDYYYAKDTLDYYAIGAYSNVITIKAAVPTVYAYTSVTANSVKLSMGSDAGNMLTGYEIARKNGKKYEVLKKTTDDIYTDSKLKSDTTYKYRIRGYYYNKETKKTYYSDAVYVEATTWGSALGLKATAASTTSVKLTWSKVSGAKGYEVYRYVGSGDVKKSNTYGESDGSFNKAQLIKTINNVKTTSYTDKNLTAGTGYSYIVRAYRVINGKTYYISEEAYATLKLTAPSIVSVKQSTKTGKTTVTWKRVPAAKGYLIEKYDSKTGKWKTAKKITKNTTTKYVAPAVTGEDTYVEYRIRAFSGKKYSYSDDSTEFKATRHIAVVSNVKAKATTSSGSIKVTWKKVSGADYYRVYRTTSSYSLTNAVTGTLDARGDVVRNYTKNNKNESGYEGRDYVTTTSIVDKRITYTNDYGEEVVVNEGPKTGVKYYYYVVAYKIVDEDYNAKEAAANKEYLTNYTAVSSYGCAKQVSATLAAAKPATPVIKSVKSSAKKQVTITLKSAAKNAEYYEIYRSTSKTKGFTLVGTTTKTSFTDKKATSKKTYYYKVKAVSTNDAGLPVTSALSKVSAKVKVK